MTMPLLQKLRAPLAASSSCPATRMRTVRDAWKYPRSCSLAVSLNEALRQILAVEARCRWCRNIRFNSVAAGQPGQEIRLHRSASRTPLLRAGALSDRKKASGQRPEASDGESRTERRLRASTLGLGVT